MFGVRHATPIPTKTVAAVAAQHRLRTPRADDTGASASTANVTPLAAPTTRGSRKRFERVPPLRLSTPLPTNEVPSQATYGEKGAHAIDARGFRRFSRKTTAGNSNTNSGIKNIRTVSEITLTRYTHQCRLTACASAASDRAKRGSESAARAC